MAATLKAALIALFSVVLFDGMVLYNSAGANVGHDLLVIGVVALRAAEDAMDAILPIAAVFVRYRITHHRTPAPVPA